MAAADQWQTPLVDVPSHIPYGPYAMLFFWYRSMAEDYAAHQGIGGAPAEPVGPVALQTNHATAVRLATLLFIVADRRQAAPPHPHDAHGAALSLIAHIPTMSMIPLEEDEALGDRETVVRYEDGTTGTFFLLSASELDAK